MIKIGYFLCNPYFRENCWIAYDGGKAVLVDPGFTEEAEFTPFLELMRKEDLTLEAVFITHWHFDHIFGVNRLLSVFKDVPVYMSPEDKDLQAMGKDMAALFDESADVMFGSVGIADGDVLEAAGHKWEVIATPGHSKGGVCYYCREEGIIFSGDTLFAGSIGRSDLHGADYEKLIVSIMDRLMGLDGATEVLPGHGRSTTISDERTHNPFLEPWGEAIQDYIDWNEEGIELNGQG